MAARFESDEEGFTLVELMVVIVIIGLLAAVVIFNVMPAADKARKTTAGVSVQQIDQAIEMYRLDNGRYPTNEEGIQALVTGRFLRRVERDPWGNAFIYRIPGTDGRSYDVVSLGADGREGGTGENADIAN
jgi:general secretion pathway protein G